jgi:DNA modification methylase/superfamily II DNA or RNA helicase
MTSDYKRFLASKRVLFTGDGKPLDHEEINPILFPFQRDIVAWAVRHGRAAIFADTGLGKTFMQIEWARLMGQKTLILAPLSVIHQTIDEAERLDVCVNSIRDSGNVTDGINIINYENLHKINSDEFGAVVLDESSILKSLNSKTRQRLLEMFSQTRYRLACTATPAPNDIQEIANHAEFLGVMRRTDMLAKFFVHDSDGWRLKGHSEEAFFRWMASWAMAVQKPSDLGYEDDGFILPELTIKPIWVQSEYVPDGQLFFTGLSGIQERSAVRRETINERCQRAADMINKSDEQWLVWHGLNDEGYALADRIPGAMLIEGKTSDDDKVNIMRSFQRGETRALITKPSIAGFGINLQNCHKMAFVGLSDSWESYYQAIRRCYRFGQKYPVDVFIILSDVEDAIWENIQQKGDHAERMTRSLIDSVSHYEREELSEMTKSDFVYSTDSASGKNWTLMLGDSCERMAEIDDESIDMSVFSPPFSSLFVYSNTERDLGNSDHDEFMRHFRYIVNELYRITKPGRIAAVHVADITATLVSDGYIGLKDLSGDVVKLFIDCGWIYSSRIPIDKNQQAQAIRTHAKGLTMTQMEKDRSWSRPALPDYILKFRKPGENAVPINSDEVNRDLWIEWANPIWPGKDDDRAADTIDTSAWWGIRETDVLQNWRDGRGDKDERHICPLQLGTIERCVLLWSNPGETVFTPFAGIGSEPYIAVKNGRDAIGIELKPEYYAVAVRNMQNLEREMHTVDLFDYAGIELEKAAD